MEYLRTREQKLRDTNESTNERVKWFAYGTMGMLVGLGAWQVVYLRAYFRYVELFHGVMGVGDWRTDGCAQVETSDMIELLVSVNLRDEDISQRKSIVVTFPNPYASRSPFRTLRIAHRSGLITYVI